MSDKWKIPQADLDEADDPLRTAVFTCIGAASITYKTEAGNEIFDDKTAREIGEWLIGYILDYVSEGTDA